MPITQKNYIATHKTGGWIFRILAETIEQAKEQVSKMLLTPVDRWTITETPVDEENTVDDLVKLAAEWKDRATTRGELLDKIGEIVGEREIDKESCLWQQDLKAILTEAGYISD